MLMLLGLRIWMWETLPILCHNAVGVRLSLQSHEWLLLIAGQIAKFIDYIDWAFDWLNVCTWNNCNILLRVVKETSQIRIG